jgi:uncharacterized membrane protein
MMVLACLKADARRRETISKNPVIAFVAGAVSMIVAGFGTFYSVLAVGVSDGPGHLTAQFMLAVCILVALAALLVVARATRALWASL